MKAEISPVSTFRAEPATENVADEPVWVFANVNGERPSGLLAVTSAGIAGVHVCPGAGGNPQLACPPTPVKIKVRSRAISAGTIESIVTKLGSENGWFIGAVACVRLEINPSLPRNGANEPVAGGVMVKLP